MSEQIIKLIESELTPAEMERDEDKKKLLELVDEEITSIDIVEESRAGIEEVTDVTDVSFSSEKLPAFNRTQMPGEKLSGIPSVNKFLIGAIINIPRNDGTITKAQILRPLEKDSFEVQWEENGNHTSKKVKKSELEAFNPNKAELKEEIIKLRDLEYVQEKIPVGAELNIEKDGAIKKAIVIEHKRMNDEVAVKVITSIKNGKAEIELISTEDIAVLNQENGDIKQDSVDTQNDKAVGNWLNKAA